MKSKVVKTLTRNFEFPELIFDIVFTATILALSKATIALIPANGTFLGSVKDLFLLFLYLFGLSSYLSNVYYEIARKHNTLNIFRFFKYGLVAQLLVFLIAIMILAIPYSILSEFDALTVANLLIGSLGLLFGFSIGIELRFERDPSVNRQLEIAFRKRYDSSLKNFLPYLLVTGVIVFPLEFLLRRFVYRYSVLLHFAAIALICYACYMIARWLERRVFVYLEIKKYVNTWTASVVSALSAVAVCGFALWEASVVNDVGRENIKVVYKLLMLFFIGVIPIRVIHIVYSRSSLANKVIAVATIMFFVIRKLNILEWGQ